MSTDLPVKKALRIFSVSFILSLKPFPDKLLVQNVTLIINDKEITYEVVYL